MDDRLNVGELIWVFLAHPVLAIVVGGVLLRAACALYNKLAFPSSVSEPPLNWACVIALTIWVLDFVAGFAIGYLMGEQAQAGGADVRKVLLQAELSSSPVGVVQMALQRMLPTSLGQESTVPVFYLLTALPVGVLLMAMLLVIMLPTSFGRAIVVTVLYVLIVVLITALLLLVIFLFRAALPLWSA